MTHIVGQKHFQNVLAKESVINGKMQPFIVVSGRGKEQVRMILEKLASDRKCDLVFVGHKVDEIREIIDMAYSQVNPIIYAILESDRMSLGAKNAMLKITEEPPNMATFIMFTENMESVLPTIKSRAYKVNMGDYNEKELIAYANIEDLSDTEKYYIKAICEVPEDVDMLVGMANIEGFGDFVENVVRGIPRAKLSNALKVSTRLSTKADDGKYNVRLFMQAMRGIYYQNARNQSSHEYLYMCLDSMKEINQGLHDLTNPSISVAMTIDAVLRKVWGVWNA